MNNNEHASPVDHVSADDALRATVLNYPLTIKAKLVGLVEKADTPIFR